MPLLDHLNSLPLLRPLGVPENIRHICVIALKEYLAPLEEFLAARPNVKPELLCLPDVADTALAKLRVELPDGSPLPAVSIIRIQHYPQYEKVFICPAQASVIAPYLTEICRFLAGNGIRNLYLAGKNAPEYSLRSPEPDYYSKNQAQLTEAFKLFRDEESRETFIARIKAIITGNAGYLPISSHMEYYHPLAEPEAGDILIDGGVSDLVDFQKKFASSVGEKGHVYGFEPIPRLWQSAKDKLEPFQNYTLVNAGLSDKAGKVFFDDLSDSSHISANNAPAAGRVECAMTAIDKFCGDNGIKHVDCIKLDVEGAELAALRGAEQIIKTCSPKLIVCLYHKPRDLFEIPLYVKTLLPDCSMRLTHSSCQFMDTILYVRPHSK